VSTSRAIVAVGHRIRRGSTTPALSPDHALPN